MDALARAVNHDCTGYAAGHIPSAAAPKARAIAFSESPFCQRSHINDLSAHGARGIAQLLRSGWYRQVHKVDVRT
jgi:hypothetical protein